MIEFRARAISEVLAARKRPAGTGTATVLVFALLGAAAFGPTYAAVAAAPVRFFKAYGNMEIDGRLDEPAWRTATPLTKFFETYPRSIAEPEVGTEARFLYDYTYVYVGVTAYDPDPESIRSGFVRRDSVTRDQDYVEVRLDPLNTKRSALVFRTNANGVSNDAQFNEDRQSLDLRPDFDFDVQTASNDRGWEAEFRIPLSTFRYRPGKDQSWAFVLYRNRPRSTASTIASIPEPRSAACVLCFAGEIQGISIDRSQPPVYVTPHVTYAHRDDGDELRGGVDLKWLMRSDTVVDLTVAPDFSQVEADDLQLTANAQFTLGLKEKRPFFLEGADLLAMPINAVYTRSFSDPDAGTRITHRGDDYDYSALLLRDRGGGILVEPGPLSSRAIPQPLGSTAVVGRYKQTLGPVSWGALASARLNDGDGENYVYGLDATWALGKSDRFAAQLLASATTNPNRPDLAPSWDGRKVDGTAYSLSWQHFSDRWYTSLLQSSYSSGFRAWNGFVPRVDVSTSSATGGLFFYPESRFLLRFAPTLLYSSVRELGGAEISSDLAPGLSFSMPYGTELSVSWHPKAQNTTFAGPRTYSYLSTTLTTAPTTWLRGLSLTGVFGDGINFSTGEVARAMTLTASVPLRLLDRLELTTSVGYQAQHSRGQSDTRRLFTQRNAQVHALWHFSSKLYMQALYQSSRFVPGTQGDSLSQPFGSESETISALLSYQANWQTRYFIGLRRNVTDLTGSAARGSEDTEIFAKFSYVLSPWR